LLHIVIFYIYVIFFSPTTLQGGKRGIIIKIKSRIENYFKFAWYRTKKICALCTQISFNENLILVELTHYHPRLALTARLNLSLNKYIYMQIELIKLYILLHEQSFMYNVISCGKN